MSIIDNDAAKAREYEVLFNGLAHTIRKALLSADPQAFNQRLLDDPSGVWLDLKQVLFGVRRHIMEVEEKVGVAKGAIGYLLREGGVFPDMEAYLTRIKEELDKPVTSHEMSSNEQDTDK